MNMGKILLLFILPMVVHCEATPNVSTKFLTVLIDFANHAVKSMANNWKWILDTFSSTNTNGTDTNATEFPPGFKILITNGLDYANDLTEIIDVTNPNFTCNNLIDESRFEAYYPRERLGYAIGGMVEGSPMVCGGMGRDRRPTNQCFTFQNKIWKPGNYRTAPSSGHIQTKVDLIANELSEPRMNMATGNVILNGKLLASGGKYSGRREPTNELLGLETKTMLTKLPKYLYGHCAVQVDEAHLMILGGFHGLYRRETLIYNLETHAWTDGPPMLDSRYGFGCTKVKVGQKEYILAAGGTMNEPRDKSVEYLDVSAIDSGWIRGHDLPRKNRYLTEN